MYNMDISQYGKHMYIDIKYLNSCLMQFMYSTVALDKTL